jgi:hypothetical protein
MLSAEDRRHLATLCPKMELVEDRVRGVRKEFSTGLYWGGEGGTSKSCTVLPFLSGRQEGTMSHAMVPVKPGQVRDVNHTMRLSRAFAASGFFRDAGDAAQVLVKVVAGR